MGTAGTKGGPGVDISPTQTLVNLTLPAPESWTRDFALGSLSFPNLELGSDVLTGPRKSQRQPAMGSGPYHELGVAVLEGAPRVPIALLLAVYHAALHSILDLGRESRGGQRRALLWNTGSGAMLDCKVSPDPLRPSAGPASSLTLSLCPS